MSKQTLKHILHRYAGEEHFDDDEAIAAIVEAVEGLIPARLEHIEYDTEPINDTDIYHREATANQIDGHNNCREQVLEAIKEWQKK